MRASSSSMIATIIKYNNINKGGQQIYYKIEIDNAYIFSFY